MLLTISSTTPPATDLGYLLHKNPTRCQSFELPFGTAHVFYPEASDDLCTVAMLLEVDPVGLVRGEGRTLKEYVNDRPYTASSFLSVAISRVFGTAMRGKSKERQGAGLPSYHLRPRLHGARKPGAAQGQEARDQALARPQGVRPRRGGP